jgi:hypothetical protein
MNWRDKSRAASLVRVAMKTGHSKLILNGTAKDAIWSVLGEGGAPESRRSAALTDIEHALDKYSKAGDRLKKIANRKAQRKNADDIVATVTKLSRQIDNADDQTRMRLWRGSAPKNCADRNRVGEQRLNEALVLLTHASRHALARAQKRSGRGRHATDPGMLDLVADLGEIWQKHSGKPFNASRKDHKKSTHQIAFPRRFIDTVLTESLEIRLKPAQLSNVMTEGRKTIKARKEQGADSDASDRDQV